jgi:hypothetical protein
VPHEPAIDSSPVRKLTVAPSVAVRTVGAMAAPVVLPWVHRVFANLKRGALAIAAARGPLADNILITPQAQA